jgi:hypothetical protein
VYITSLFFLFYVTLLIKNFSAFYGSRKFISMFTAVLQSFDLSESSPHHTLCGWVHMMTDEGKVTHLLCTTSTEEYGGKSVLIFYLTTVWI